MMHILVITRTQDTMQGGGDDSITLSELLAEAGYYGKFDVEVFNSTNTEEVIHNFIVDNR